MHNSIGVKVCLVKRGVVVDDLCPICQRKPESIIHAIRDCVWVKTIWIQLEVSISNQVFWTSNLQDWIILNGKASSSCDRGNLPWKSIFSFAMYDIWKNRNMVVFNRRVPNQNLSKEIMNQSLEFFYCVQSPRSPSLKALRAIQWEKPPTGWKKLNTNGSCLNGSDRTGCGGLVRDEHGSWIGGFTRYIGSTNSFIAELWGLKEGLLLCYNLNIDFLLVEVVAQAVVEIFKNDSYVNNAISPLLDDFNTFGLTLATDKPIVVLIRGLGWVLSRFLNLFLLVVLLWTFLMPLMMIVMVCCSTGFVLFLM